MKRFFLVLLFLSSWGLYVQKVGIINRQATYFQLIHKKDTIDFIVVDTVFNQKKPLFLFCEGSLPTPLFIDFGNDEIFMFGGGISNFDIDAIRKHYHLAVISKPSLISG